MNTVAILSALLSIVAYTFYSKNYEKTVRQVENPLVSAALLYGLSSLILIGMTFLSAVVFGFKTTLSDPSVWAASSGGILKLIGLMSLLYYGHIVSEAICRKQMNMGFYAIFFQANIVVIVALNWWFHDTPVSIWSFMGGFLVLVSSVAVLFFSQKSNKTAFVAHDKKTGWAIFSALTCGAALFIDGEMSHAIVFKNGYHTEGIAPFLFYEFLTFFLPTCWAFMQLFLQSGIKKTIFDIKTAFQAHKRSYGLSALFSVGQFVFSVFALTFPNDRVVVAVVLGASPFLNVWLDKNIRDKNLIKIEVILSFITLIGLALVISHA